MAMTMMWRRTLAGACVAAVIFAAGGCEVRSREADRRDGADVAIRTPVGAMTVQTGDSTVPETGLPVYPGARPLREDGEEQATVEIDTPIFGLKVAAAKFESDQGPEPILAFYREALAEYGEITECRGNIDFGRRGDDARPRCRSDRRSDEVTLATGTRANQRMVVVESRRSGSRFSLVHVQTRGGD